MPTCNLCSKPVFPYGRTGGILKPVIEHQKGPEDSTNEENDYVKRVNFHLLQLSTRFEFFKKNYDRSNNEFPRPLGESLNRVTCYNTLEICDKIGTQEDQRDSLTLLQNMALGISKNQMPIIDCINACVNAIQSVIWNRTIREYPKVVDKTANFDVVAEWYVWCKKLMFNELSMLYIMYTTATQFDNGFEAIMDGLNGDVTIVLILKLKIIFVQFCKNVSSAKLDFTRIRNLNPEPSKHFIDHFFKKHGVQFAPPTK